MQNFTFKTKSNYMTSKSPKYNLKLSTPLSMVHLTKKKERLVVYSVECV